MTCKLVHHYKTFPHYGAGEAFVTRSVSFEPCPLAALARAARLARQPHTLRVGVTRGARMLARWEGPSA